MSVKKVVLATEADWQNLPRMTFKEAEAQHHRTSKAAPVDAPNEESGNDTAAKKNPSPPHFSR